MILIIEPKLLNVQHIPVNCSFISIIRKQYPEEKIVFAADKDYIENAKIFFSHNNLNIDNIDYHPIDVIQVSSGKQEFKSIPNQFKILTKLINKLQPEKILFLYTHRPAVLFAKWFALTNKKIPISMIFHSDLESLLDLESDFRKKILSPYNLHWGLKFCKTPQTKYIVLSEHMKPKLLSMLPNLDKNLIECHHPYIFEEAYEHKPFKDNVIRFSTFGEGYKQKGTDLLFELAQNIDPNQTNYKPEFSLIGAILDPQLKPYIEKNTSVKVAAQDKRISREEFSTLAKDIDYALYFYRNDAYQLTASGAFLDALTYLKPIIARKNPFFEYYFNLLGDIGYLCEDYDEIEQVIKNILENPSKERYLHQRENLLKARTIFEIDSIANTTPLF